MTAAFEDLPVFPQQDGVFVLNKPSGPSSAHCLRIFKHLGQKKVGHAGTLDPLAEGVLLVLLGQGTKLSPWLLEGGKKTYRGILRLGLETDSWDITGKTICEKPFANIRRDDVEKSIKEWLFLEKQEVPAFSAARHNGRPLYKLARKGIDTPLKIKKINVSEADLLEMDPPFVIFRVTCSSGSYIRSLAHSLGKRLGCGASLSGLIREYSHPFGLASAVSLDELRANPALLPEHVHSFEQALPNWLVIELSEQEMARIKNGNPIPAKGEAPSDKAILRHAGKPLALASHGEDNGFPCWIVLRGLWN